MASANLQVTQINLQHCKEASSLLSYLISKLQTGLALVQEPWVYKNRVRGLNIRGGHLYYDSTCEIPRTCIVVTGAVQAKMLVQLTSRDMTAVKITISVGGENRDAVIGSVYLPYDAQHHTCWGSSDTNSRGNALLDYLVTTELDILNAGVKPTFVTARRQEVIDISLATADIVTDVISWRVSEEESLSDHRYIKCQIRSDHLYNLIGETPGLHDGTHLMRTSLNQWKAALGV